MKKYKLQRVLVALPVSSFLFLSGFNEKTEVVEPSIVIEENDDSIDENDIFFSKQEKDNSTVTLEDIILTLSERDINVNYDTFELKETMTEQICYPYHLISYEDTLKK